MSRQATLSPLGLYEWDNTLFDLMLIPDRLEKETLIDNLLAETAELEVLYPNPVVLKSLIGVWSRKQKDIWDRLLATTLYDYNPIENYNRYEDGTTTGNGTTTHSGTDTTTETSANTGTDNVNRTTSTGGTDTVDMTRRDGGTQRDSTSSTVTLSGSDTVAGTDHKEHWVAGFDAPTPTAQDDGLFKQTRDESTASSTTTYGKVETGTGNNTTTFGKTEDNQDKTTYGKNETVTQTTAYNTGINKNTALQHGENINNSQEGTHTLHAHGNIGVMSTQEMIARQREIELFNVYDIIIQDFKNRFCILVY